MNHLNHVAIIMDGNGRWGLKHKNSRNAGHKAGLKTVEKIIKETIKNKIKFLTLYAFSTENWRRPKKEIDYLFDLDDVFLNEILIFSKKISSSLIRTVDCNRVGVSVIGLEVPHAHVHLIPINNEKDMNFSNKRIEMSSEDFADLQSRIIKNL